MNYQQLKTLITMVKCGSFSKAEEILYLSKPAIKKQLDSLEEELAFSILVRTRQGIFLTPAGGEFFSFARKTLEELESTIQRCRELSLRNQVLRIENPYHPHLLLQNVFQTFSARFPSVKLIVQTSSDYVEDILNNYADVAECTYSAALERPGIKYTYLFPIPYKCLITPNHPLAHKERIHPRDLVGYHVGLMQKNIELSAHLQMEYPALSLEEFLSNDLQNIIKMCYENGIYITKASFADILQPLITVPLETDLVPMGVIVYQESPTEVVKAFLKVVDELYPQKRNPL
jgi:DNA-binding transcriptional LysR family regulator